MWLHKSASFILGLLIVGTQSVSAQQRVAFQIKDHQGRYLDVLSADGRPILRYVYLRDTSDKQKDIDTVKVFLHVFAADGKTTLTQGPGAKLYPHHRGIFVGWSRLQHGGKTHNLWGQTGMAQVHRKFLEAKADEEGAVISSIIDWSGAGGQKVLEEERTHRLVAAKDAHVVLDVKTVLKATDGDVKLDGDPEHAGLQFRPSPQVAENKSAQYTFHSPQIDPRKDLDLPWVAETFQVDDTLWTVQMMNHPDNPPGARWSAYRDYGRFGPFTVLEIADGDSCTLQYRFRITQGPAPAREQLQAQYERYVKLQRQ
jgi:hypothetical protein